MSGCGHDEETTLDFRTGRYVCMGCLRAHEEKEEMMRCVCGGVMVAANNVDVCYDCARSRKSSP